MILLKDLLVLFVVKFKELLLLVLEELYDIVVLEIIWDSGDLFKLFILCGGVFGWYWIKFCLNFFGSLVIGNCWIGCGVWFLLRNNL